MWLSFSLTWSVTLAERGGELLAEKRVVTDGTDTSL